MTAAAPTWTMDRVRTAVTRRYAFLTGNDGHSQRLRLRTWCKGKGIEIGALHCPLPLPKGASVDYVDRLPNEELRRHYPELNSEPLVPVTILASAEDLSPVPSGSLDFVVANHLLEHCENPVRALAEFHRVLKKHGTVYLALPDPRHTFDRERDLTSVEHLMDEFRFGSERSRFAHYVDWAINVDHRDIAHAEDLMRRSYSIHFHVWRRETFLAFLDAAKEAAGLTFGVADSDQGDNEFIFILRKGLTASDRLWQLVPQANRVRAAAREVRAAIRTVATE